MASFFNTGEPDFVNEIGTKFWKDQVGTDYACKQDAHDRKLNAVCFYMETKATETEPSHRGYILVDKKTNEVLAEASGVEAMGVRIDILKFLSTEKKSAKRKSKKAAQ